MRRRLTLLLATTLALAGCVYQNNPTPPAPSTLAPLTIEVTGTCADDEGLRLKSSGFTPGGEYLTEAWYPDGTKYPKSNLLKEGIGTANANGDTPGWRWDCKKGVNGQPDRNGTYRLRVTNQTDGRSVETTFVVKL